VLEIFSIKGQSLESELAIFIIGKSKYSHKSTESSSKGVAIGIQPTFFISLTKTPKLSLFSLVTCVFFI